MDQTPEASSPSLGQLPVPETPLPELPETADSKPETPNESPPQKPDSPPKHKTEDPKPDRPKKKPKKDVTNENTPEIPNSDENAPESGGDNQNQLVLYNPNPSLENREIVPVVSNPVHNRVLPSIGAFTVQCAACFKWRLIPTKEKYEAIRERILQEPFVCERAKEWRPEVSCEDKEDISQDGSRLWAIDKPNIAQPPKGWERLIHIRGEGSTRFADVYYASPNGKKLRSMVEIEKFLNENPEYKTEGVSLSQFSFQIPRPLHDNYVRKRVPTKTPPVPPPSDAADLSKPLELEDVNPIAWAPPTSNGEPLPSVTPSSVDQVDPVNPVNPPVKRKIIVKPPSREKNLSPSPARAAPTLPTLSPCSMESEVRQNTSPSGDQI